MAAGRPAGARAAGPGAGEQGVYYFFRCHSRTFPPKTKGQSQAGKARPPIHAGKPARTSRHRLPLRKRTCAHARRSEPLPSAPSQRQLLHHPSSLQVAGPLVHQPPPSLEEVRARMSHQLSAAAADPLAVAGRTPSRRFDVVTTTPAASFSPCDPPHRRLDALATNAGETCGLKVRSWLLLEAARRAPGRSGFRSECAPVGHALATEPGEK